MSRSLLIFNSNTFRTNALSLIWFFHTEIEREREGRERRKMASASSPSSDRVRQNPKKPQLGLLANAIKRKDSFIQLFFMTGILLLSMRSVGQKYRINDLQEDTSSLREEQESLSQRMNSIKQSLLREASLDSTGLFASRLRLLFNEDPSSSSSSN